MRLARVAFAGIDLEGLPPGRWRAMTRDELVQLKKTYGVPRSIPSGTPLVEAPGKRPKRTVPPRTHGPRYGGGAPARRSPETTEDWGGGQKRGSSGGRFTPRENGEHREHGGRLGRTRTTGTGGGIGARGPTERVKGRRGR